MGGQMQQWMDGWMRHKHWRQREPNNDLIHTPHISEKETGTQKREMISTKGNTNQHCNFYFVFAILSGVVFLNHCVFYLFKQISPLLSPCISLEFSGVESYHEVLDIDMNCDGTLVSTSSHTTHLLGWGEMTAPQSSVSRPASHVVVVRTHEENAPPFRSIKCLSRDFSH